MDCSAAVSCNQSIVQLSKPKEVFRRIPKSRIKMLKTRCREALGCGSWGTTIGIVTWAKGVTLVQTNSVMFWWGLVWDDHLIYLIITAHEVIFKFFQKRKTVMNVFLVSQSSGWYACAAACVWGIRRNSGLHIWSKSSWCCATSDFFYEHATLSKKKKKCLLLIISCIVKWSEALLQHCMCCTK